MCSVAELRHYGILLTFTVVPVFPLSLTLLALPQIVGRVLISNYTLYIIILAMGSAFSRQSHSFCNTAFQRKCSVAK